jgi:hypothetical protein
MKVIPQELNWVEKRAACTVATIFNELRLAIESDISAINATRHTSGDNEFSSGLLKNEMGIVVGQL